MKNGCFHVAYRKETAVFVKHKLIVFTTDRWQMKSKFFFNLNLNFALYI